MGDGISRAHEGPGFLSPDQRAVKYERLFQQVRDQRDAHEAELTRLRAETAALTARVGELRRGLEKLRDCDWVITLPDRMDGVREIARTTLAADDAGEGGR